uniref:Uncharacterized protein n=1 Tax=Panagrolaimus sp. PS1159 TaxID=55785 RepID=A0AC35FE50_9BILA
MFSSKLNFKSGRSHKTSVSSYYGDSDTDNMLSNWLKDHDRSDNIEDYLVFDRRKSSTRSNSFNPNCQEPVHWVIGNSLK